MFKRLLSVGGFTLLSRVAGFLRDVLMAAVLGDGLLSDAFFVAWRLPNSFRGIFAEGAFNVAFIPRYAAARETRGEEEAARFADNVYSWQMTAQLVLLAAALACMYWIVRIMAPGFAAHSGQTELATALSRITFPYLILTVIAVQLSAMLNAHGKFAAAAAWSVLPEPRDDRDAAHGAVLPERGLCGGFRRAARRRAAIRLHRRRRAARRIAAEAHPA